VKIEQFRRQLPSGAPISFLVSSFFANAERIFETAQSGDDEVSILIGQDGAIRMFIGSDWPLESLKAHHGAQAAYQVRRDKGELRVEGRSGTASCLLRTVPAPLIARRLLASQPRYILATDSTRIV
jgi:hypothetical protein